MALIHMQVEIYVHRQPKMKATKSSREKVRHQATVRQVARHSSYHPLVEMVVLDCLSLVPLVVRQNSVTMLVRQIRDDVLKMLMTLGKDLAVVASGEVALNGEAMAGRQIDEVHMVAGDVHRVAHHSHKAGEASVVLDKIYRRRP